MERKSRTIARQITRPSWSVTPEIVRFDDRIDEELLRDLVADVAAVMESGQAYKRCRARWVVRLDHPGGPVVIKLFTERSLQHTLKQRFQRSRARRAADQAFRFVEQGFRTPLPLALLQEEHGPFRGNSCLVYEFIDGLTLAEGPGPMIEPIARAAGKTPLEFIRDKMNQTRDQLIDFGLAHLDCHGGNFMLDRDGEMYLLDIDSIRPALRRKKNVGKLKFLFSLIDEGVCRRIAFDAGKSVA
ncbi:MAG: hypothetical protein WBD20_06080 [Pirellulaceae bacterium]